MDEATFAKVGGWVALGGQSPSHTKPGLFTPWQGGVCVCVGGVHSGYLFAISQVWHLQALTLLSALWDRPAHPAACMRPVRQVSLQPLGTAPAAARACQEMTSSLEDSNVYIVGCSHTCMHAGRVPLVFAHISCNTLRTCTHTHTHSLTLTLTRRSRRTCAPWVLSPPAASTTTSWLNGCRSSTCCASGHSAPGVLPDCCPAFNTTVLLTCTVLHCCHASAESGT